MGTDHCDRHGGQLNGKIVIRRSLDGGEAWTVPDGPQTGRITDDDGWHTAPVPVAVHEGRIWRAFEFAPEPDRRKWRALVISAPEDADLLDRANWAFSEQLENPDPDAQWIEGNVLVAPDGNLDDLLQTNDISHPGCKPDRAAIVRIEDPTHIAHDPASDWIDFPGGGTKFTVRRHQSTGR